MNLQSFSDLEYSNGAKVTRREKFLTYIDRLVPWEQLTKFMQPYYPKSNGPGRPAIGLERMLRMYIAQQCMGMSNQGMEDADSQAIRRFVGIDTGAQIAPDATTLLRFRRWLEEHSLSEQIFEQINANLAACG